MPLLLLVMLRQLMGWQHPFVKVEGSQLVTQWLLLASLPLLSPTWPQSFHGLMRSPQYIAVYSLKVGLTSMGVGLKQSK